MTAAAALVLQHDDDAPPGHVATWAQDRGIALEVVGAGAGLPDPAGRPFVVTLGSESSAADDGVPWLAAERALLDRALALDVPVLGICFGAQHLARALGATVAPAPRLELGWLEIETHDAGRVPPGPWMQWHRDAFTLPPGAQLLATSPVGPQAFAAGPHLGVQFHPEADVAIVDGWAASPGDALARVGTTAAALHAAGTVHAPGARTRAWRLLDAFLVSAHAHGRAAAAL